MTDPRDVRCCICHEPCVKDPPNHGERWHWGPDGMHCHFCCEDEYRRRYVAPERGMFDVLLEHLVDASDREGRS